MKAEGGADVSVRRFQRVLTSSRLATPACAFWFRKLFWLCTFFKLHRLFSLCAYLHNQKIVFLVHLLPRLLLRRSVSKMHLFNSFSSFAHFITWSTKLHKTSNLIHKYANKPSIKELTDIKIRNITRRRQRIESFTQIWCTRTPTIMVIRL